MKIGDTVTVTFRGDPYPVTGVLVELVENVKNVVIKTPKGGFVCGVVDGDKIAVAKP